MHWENMQQLFGEKGAIMELYRDIGWLVCEEEVYHEPPADGSKLLDYKDFSTVFDSHPVKFQIACLEPRASMPGYLLNSPVLELRQLNTTALVEMWLQPELGRANRMALKEITAEHTVMRQTIFVDGDFRATGCRQMKFGSVPMQPKEVEEAIYAAAASLQEVRAVVDLGYYKLHHPHIEA